MVESQEHDSPIPFPKTAFDIIAIATSAGGLRALGQILSALPSTFPAAIVVVQHLAPQYCSLMANILGRQTSLSVKEAEEGDRLSPAIVYLAPPNYHLLVKPEGTLSLSQSKLVHFVRPSADILFKSVAASYKERAIAVVLTGMGSDGNAGVQAIKKGHGLVIAQDKESSDFFSMPEAAIWTGCVDFILPLAEIPGVLIALVMRGEVK